MNEPQNTILPCPFCGCEPYRADSFAGNSLVKCSQYQCPAGKNFSLLKDWEKRSLPTATGRAPEATHVQSGLIREREQLREIISALPSELVGTPGTQPATLEWFAEKFGYKCGFPCLVEALRKYAALRRRYFKPFIDAQRVMMVASRPHSKEILSPHSNAAGADKVNQAPLSHGSLTGFNTPPPLLAQTAKDSGEKEAPSDRVEHVLQKKLSVISWQAYPGDSFNPEWSGYTAGEYHTGNPYMGWCLYSRGNGGCWNQRTKTEMAPEPNAYPQRFADGWWWVVDGSSVSRDGGSHAMGASSKESPPPPVLAQTLDTERLRDPLERTQELFDLLQGTLPDGYKIPRLERPKLTADQAWTVIWYLGNQYWQVTDHIDRCDVCGSLYNTYQEGHCLDYGKPPYNFCESCREYAAKELQRPKEPADAAMRDTERL